jgi:hypothetical protein
MRSRPAPGAANFEFTEGDFGIWVRKILALTGIRVGVFKPAPQHEKSVNELFDQVIAWSSALKALR